MDKKIRIAIASEDNCVCGHFGYCSQFTLVDIENKTIVKKELIPNPGHKPGFLPLFLSEKGVNVIIAGGMGAHAQELFSARNILTIIGAFGPIDNIIDAYINKTLKVGESQCSHDLCGDKQ